MRADQLAQDIEIQGAMDQHAERMSIAFMEWVGVKGYKYYKGEWYKNGINYHKVDSSADLYKMFIKEILGK